MYKKWHKTPSKKPPQRSWDEDEMKVIGWCMNKNIKVSISPDWKDELQRWKIEININDGMYSEYASSNVEQKAQIEMEAFKYFNDMYTAKGKDSPRMQNIRFENFVKICNPEKSNTLFL